MDSRKTVTTSEFVQFTKCSQGDYIKKIETDRACTQRMGKVKNAFKILTGESTGNITLEGIIGLFCYYYIRVFALKILEESDIQLNLYLKL